MVDNIINIVRNNILDNNLFSKGERVVVAVSGGPDSMCLLDVLYRIKDEFKIELEVAHVNHGIRKESDDEKIYVENYCNLRNIPFHYLKVNIPTLAKEKKISEETCGREVRYGFFEKVRKETNSNCIAVAHNLNDNVETILLNEIRGCGLKGLTGMDFKFNYVIRPLLTIEKKDILVYNSELGLDPCIDKTNEEEIYLRNKIRLSLIPYLQELNPNFVTNISRMRLILKEENDFIVDYVDKIVDNCILEENEEKIIFDYSKSMKEHDCIKKRVIRNIIEKKLSNLDGIESIHVLDIIKMLNNNIKGKKYIIGNKFTIEILKKNIAVIY